MMITSHVPQESKYDIRQVACAKNGLFFISIVFLRDVIIARNRFYIALWRRANPR